MRSAIKILLSGIFLCLIFCSCADGKGAYDISQYIESFKAMDYTAMFSFAAPAVDIDEDTFVQKYDTIFSGLGVTEITINDLAGPDSSGVYTYTATYKTKNYGDYTNNFTLKAGFKNKKCVVLWDYSLIFPEMDEGSRLQIKTLKADRGEMFASDGTLLAENTFADTVYMDTTKVKDITALANVICPITGLSNTKLIDMFNTAVKKGIGIVSLHAYFSGQLTEEQKLSILAVPGLGIDDKLYTPIRNYPLSQAAAHIIGYTGFVDEKSLPEGYSVSDRIGLSGLEAAYESTLRGSDGKIIYIEDRWGNNIRTLYEVPLKQGEDLRLSIKPDLQQEAYNALGTYLKNAQTGVAIVMDAKTGYVEAMTSYPSYDDNIFTFPVSEETMQQLSAADSHQPLFSRATQGLYPPGSVIKPFTATAALEAGAITADTVFTGKIVDNQWTPEGDNWHWLPIKRVDDSGTPLKLDNALIKSDNIFFAFAALKLGSEALTDYFSRIGFNEAVPFDLPVNAANLINTNRKMDLRLLADMGYGQGDILLTPLQLAAMYTAFAGESGDMLEPILVPKVCRTDGLKYDTVSEKQPTVWVKDAVSGNSLHVLMPMMEDVINKGTGKPARVSGVKIAGKTGTAEIGNDKSREISWFSGFWVDGYYDRLVVVMVDVAANEGSVKFDIAKALLSP